MIKPNKNKNGAVFIAALSIPVMWLGVIISNSKSVGDFMGRLNAPFSLYWNGKQSLRCILIMLIIYGFCIALYYSQKGHKRIGEEHGSAKWGTPREIRTKYMDFKNPFNNAILTQNTQIGMNGYKHKRNLNILVVGGSGSGKTRFFAKPNIMQANCSYIIADPKGEMLRSLAPLFQAKGIPITVLNLVDMEQSDGYNPFRYLKSDIDAFKLITNLIANTTPKNANKSDPFWEQSEKALLQALVLYLLHEAPIYEQNFGMVMYLVENCATKEDENYQSPVDVLFEDLEKAKPKHIAVKQYKIFKQASGKTAKSILVSLAVRLSTFNIPIFQHITSYDNMDLGDLGEHRRAIFAVIPDNDTSFNYLVGMLYSQAFQELYHKADYEHNGRLPVHVRVMMDEFANVALPDDFERILATCRSREISINIIIQNIAQIKALFEKSWENITGNCDTFLYLGGNEQSTYEYVSKLLGKETIDTTTRGVTKGKSGSSSKNFQNTGRELLTPDEVRMLDNKYALLFLRGERPIIDNKYNIMQHPNVALTTDGGAEEVVREVKILPEISNDLSKNYSEREIQIYEEI